MYTDELKELYQTAQDGDVESFIAIADIYYNENPASRMAFDWYMRAACKSHVRGQYMTGLFYLYGSAVSFSTSDAYYWFKKAYEQGCADSIEMIGYMIEHYDISHYPDLPFSNAEDCYLEYERLKKKKESAPVIFTKDYQNENCITAKDKLSQMVGLFAVKEKLNHITKKIEFDHMRRQAGLPCPESSHNFVFMGNAGVGKTEIARLTAAILKENGTLNSGHLIETDRSGLCGEYLGETAQKTKEVILSALDGVLFIDEAYALSRPDSPKDYGAEAIAVLVKMMEDYKDRLVVILAGYTNEMEALLRMNPGLKSRFNNKIYFPDYSAQELSEIYKRLAYENAYRLDEQAEKALDKLMKQAVREMDAELGNGRFVRNAFEQTIENLSYRVMNLKLRSVSDLQNISFTDIPSIDDLLGRENYKNAAGDNVTRLF